MYQDVLKGPSFSLQVSGRDWVPAVYRYKEENVFSLAL